jgi:hypothetical protein
MQAMPVACGCLSMACWERSEPFSLASHNQSWVACPVRIVMAHTKYCVVRPIVCVLASAPVPHALLYSPACVTAAFLFANITFSGIKVMTSYGICRRSRFIMAVSSAFGIG